MRRYRKIVRDVCRTFDLQCFCIRCKSIIECNDDIIKVLIFRIKRKSYRVFLCSRCASTIDIPSYTGFIESEILMIVKYGVHPISSNDIKIIPIHDKQNQYQ